MRQSKAPSSPKNSLFELLKKLIPQADDEEERKPIGQARVVEMNPPEHFPVEEELEENPDHD